jgi:hypothetical protein
MIGENVLKTKVEMVRANNIWKIPHVNLFLYKQAHKQKVKICSKSLGYLNVHDVSINFNERGGWNQVQIQGFFSTNQSFMVDYVVPILQLCLRRGGGVIEYQDCSKVIKHGLICTICAIFCRCSILAL